MERLATIAELPVDTIGIEERLRDVSTAGVETLKEAIAARGFPGRIQVRRTPDGDVVLDGAHRLTAMRELGRETIPVDLFRCNDAEARMAELDGNLAGAELTPLDTAVFLAERKAVYEKMHPETAAGVAGASARWNATDTMSVAAFARVTADKFGISERHVRRLVAAGTALDPRDRRLLRHAPRPVMLSDLMEIAKVTNAAERYYVVEALSEGVQSKVSAARAAWKREREGTPQPETDADRAFRALLSAWARAPREMRRRFVEDHRDEIAALLDGGAGA